MANTETTWYEIESSLRGADDWYAMNLQADTLASGRQVLQNKRDSTEQFEFRLVRKTLTEEVTGE